MKNKCLYCGVEFTPNYRNVKTQKYCCKNHGHQYWRKQNPEKSKEESRKANLKKKTDPTQRSKYQTWLRKYYDRPNRRFAHYVDGAKSRGYSFELSFEQFMEFWNKPCHFCGSDIKTVGIDRLDNNLGYTLDNCAPCCETCNNMKKNLSVEIFLTQCKKIATRNSLSYLPERETVEVQSLSLELNNQNGNQIRSSLKERILGKEI